MKPRRLALAALFAFMPQTVWAETVPPPAGYEIVRSEMGLDVRFKGKSAFAASMEKGELVFAVEGPRDMTGNGVPDLAVLWRSARSASTFAIMELRPDGVASLFEDSGMTDEILAAYSELSEEKVQGLVSGTIEPAQMRPRMIPLRQKIAVPEK